MEKPPPLDQLAVVSGFLVVYSYEDSPTGLKDMLARASGWGEALTLMKFYVEHGVKY